MISFRYHVVSLIAVFLALGLGALFGVSFLDDATVRVLSEQQDRLSANNKELRDENRRLAATNEAMDAFIGLTRLNLIRDSLANTPPFVLVKFESSDRDVVDEVTETLVLAGARLGGSITLMDALDERANRPRVLQALRAEGTDDRALSSAFASQAGAGLTGKDVAALNALVAAGFIRVEPAGDSSSEATIAALGGSGIVFIASAESGGSLDRRFTVPLIRSLAEAGAIVAAVEPGITELGLLAPLREDANARLITIDAIESPSGQTALAVGLRAARAGRFGHWGIGEGSTAPLPELQPPG